MRFRHIMIAGALLLGSALPNVLPANAQTPNVITPVKVTPSSTNPIKVATATTTRPEHVVAGPMTGPGHRIVSQEPAKVAAGQHRPLAVGGANPLVSSATGPEFLTRPYVTWHSINSVFDHCNPDYSIDGKVCRFDGTVASRSNGVDPSFSSGYAMTPGGGDYLYYDGHNGWDYGLAYENVLAAADGTVRLAGTDPNNTCFGQNVIIDHPNGYSTRYAHLSSIYVAVGQAVTRGQVLGASGNTGCSSGPHLHFGVYITSSWTAIDPWGWSGPGADPWPSDTGNLWLTDYGQYPIPFAPTAVTAMGAGGTSAAVSWSAPSFDGGTPIISYRIVASPGGVTVSVPAGTTSATIAGLTAGGTYTFTVTAGNAVGVGPTSAASNPLTVSPLWAATYDISAAPKDWAVNQTQTVTVKVTNIGSQAWPSGGAAPVHLSMHFATSQGGWPNQQATYLAAWQTDQRYVLPGDVAPGASVSWNVPVTAPPTTSSTVLEAELVKEGQLWFGDWSPISVRVQAAQWAGAIDVSTVPRSWTAGQAQSFMVKVTNTGNQAWPAGGGSPVHLGVHFATAAGGFANQAAWLSDQRYGLPADLMPGASTTLALTVNAPASASMAVLELQPVKEGQFWIDARSALAISPGPDLPAASFDLTAVPRTWSANQTQTFPIKITNTGNAIWLAAGANPVHLGLHFATAPGGWTIEKATYFSAWLNDRRYALPANVAPGATVTVNVTATAPATAAGVLEAEMVKEQQFWFSDAAPLAIAVSPSLWAATFDLGAMPQTWARGQTQTFAIRATNTGNQAWPATGTNPVHIGAHFARSGGGWPNEVNSGFTSWLTDDRIALPSDVAPGTGVTLSLTLTAPAVGAGALEFEMVKEKQFWFTGWTSQALLSGPALWAATYDVSAAPRAWSGTQPQTFSVVVTNTGNQLWPSGGPDPVRLGIHFATGPGGWPNQQSSQSTAWLSDQRLSLPADLPPGASVTLAVTATAPAGSRVIEAEMVKEQEFWFSDWAPGAVSLTP